VVGGLDETLPFNRSFDERLTGLGIPHTFAVLPGIGHNPMALINALRDANQEFYRRFFGVANRGE
jgi:hypothetical protein